jgi:chromate transporter
MSQEIHYEMQAHLGEWDGHQLDNRLNADFDTYRFFGLSSLGEEPAHGNRPHAITLREAFWVWVKVAAYSFGGPAGQIAVMHKLLVEEKKWVSENRFLHALNYAMLLPGPEAQQLATYIGWLLHGTRGGLMAGILFILPGFVTIMVLSILYAGFQEVTLVQALFYGLKPAVMAVVVEAVVRIGRRALKNQVRVGLAAVAFVAIFFFDVPFPLIIFSAGVIGFGGGRLWPAWFQVIKGHEVGEEEGDTAVITDSMAAHTQPTWRRALKVLFICLALWWGPLLPGCGPRRFHPGPIVPI